MQDYFIRIKRGEGRSLKKGGAWIFDNEIDEEPGGAADGEMVRVLDFDDFFLGWGVYNSASKIRVRILSRYREEKPDRGFFKEKVRRALSYRENVVDMSACRLIFSEADGFPGFVADKYDDLLVIESLSLGMDRIKPVILSLLLDELGGMGFHIRGIYERSDAAVRKKEGMKPFKGWLYTEAEGFIEEPFNDMEREWYPSGEFPDRLESPLAQIVENGVSYRVDVENGQKTGFFLDQKYNRLLIQKLAKGKTVLDCFTHMGTFALNAARGGAASVLGLDISELAISQARDNAAINGLSDIARFEVADVLDALPDLRRKGERFDLVILDPPAFTKSRNTVKQAEKGYREINREGMLLVKDGGFLATCSCSHFMTEELLSRVISQAAISAHKRLRQVSYSAQSPDHPYLWGLDSSFYLKFFIFQVTSEV